jgi:hypothetical protein
MLCLIDEAGSLSLADPDPFRIGFLITGRGDRLESDIKRLKKELPPRGKSGEYHACEEHPNTRAMIRSLLCLNGEVQMYIVEWIKKDFSTEYFMNGRLSVFRDTNLLIGSFAITASRIAAAASANGYLSIHVIAEASKVDIQSEHRSREQAFGQVLRFALEQQARIKRPPPGTQAMIQVSTVRKSQYAPLSFVDYWLWAYCRNFDRGDTEVLPDELKRRTSVTRMTESDVRRVSPDDKSNLFTSTTGPETI